MDGVLESRRAPSAGAKAEKPLRRRVIDRIGHDPKVNAWLDRFIALPPRRPRREPPMSYCPALNAQLFEMMDWLQYERLILRMFRSQDFRVSHEARENDGHLLFRQTHEQMEGFNLVYISAAEGPIDLKQLKNFNFEVASTGARRGILFSRYGFPDGYSTVISRDRLSLIDAKGLEKHIAKRPPQQQAPLLSYAAKGEYWRPSCVLCLHKMIERPDVSGKNRGPAWSCSDQDRCEEIFSAGTARINDLD